MSITPQLDRYLSVRRSLGYDLRTAERRLRRFARFADQEGAPHIGTALFLRWDASLPAATTSTRSARLSAVRLFAQWLSSIDPAHEVPPRGLLPGRLQRPRPHIYGEAEIASIIAAAKTLPSIYGLRGLTCSTLFGLIAVTGLRISEALALDHDDLDVENGVLRVRRGKLGKERLLPLDSTVVAEAIEHCWGLPEWLYLHFEAFRREARRLNLLTPEQLQRALQPEGIPVTALTPAQQQAKLDLGLFLAAGIETQYGALLSDLAERQPNEQRGLICGGASEHCHSPKQIGQGKKRARCLYHFSTDGRISNSCTQVSRG